MNLDALSFAVQVACSVLALVIGRWFARSAPGRAWWGTAAAMALMVIWLWLQHHPAMTTSALPVGLVSYVEGTGAVPFFMFIIGIMWQRRRLPRQRRVMAMAVALGEVYFLKAGGWMLRTTPDHLLAQTPGHLQSQDYTCVLAACAIALDMLDVPTSESEMARLTRTRPGYGTTVVRALDGLQQKLAASGLSVDLMEPTYVQLMLIRPPVLLLLQLEMTQRHMVVLKELSTEGAELIDPQVGELFIPRDAFVQAYCQQVLAFDR